MKRTIIFLPIFIFSTSCGIVGDEARVEISEDDIFLQTNKKSYTARQDPDEDLPAYSFTLVTRFENRSGRTLYLATCNPGSVHPIYDIHLMEHESASHSGYSGFNNCAGRHDPIIVHSGVTRIDTLQVMGPGSWHHETHEPLGVMEGKYRLIYETLTCPAGDGCIIPDSLSWSNEFEVSLAE